MFDQFVQGCAKTLISRKNGEVLMFDQFIQGCAKNFNFPPKNGEVLMFDQFIQSSSSLL